MAPKILLFDIDGTLVRAGGAGRKALNEATSTLYGKERVCSEFSLAGRTDLWNFATAYRLATGRRPTKAAVARLYREYLRLLPRYVRRATREKTYILPPGIKTLLKRLRREPGVLLGLGTGNLEQGARIKLGPSGFNGYFRFGGFGSDSFHRDLILKKAVRRAACHAGGRVQRQDVFVIGDTPFDVAAGRKAGYKTVAVGTGFSSWAELKRSRPDHLARDFRGVDKWLKWFGMSSSRQARRRNSRAA
ncbi:MAG: haloacid dehalogenase-like hydrolase [Elusimicrobia bacterium]|nr:haloacid dehalogenase-like hydrolase [Elusimicrobiota bacterium]